MHSTVTHVAILLVVILLALLPLAARAETQNGIDTSRQAAVELVGPVTLLHSNEKHQRCENGQLELFSCALRSGGFAALCLSQKDLHTIKLEFQDKNGHYEREPFDNMQVGFQMGNAHVFNMVLRGKTNSIVTTIFASPGGSYEGGSGAISQTIDGSNSMSYCSSEKIYVPALWLKDKNGNEHPLNKDSLIKQGIAKPLTNMPDWPEIPEK